MDPQRLSAIATKAIEHTLRYHLGCHTSLDKHDKVLVRDSVHEIFPLRERARDIQVAHLEIACDAAVTFAETFNRTKPEQQQINLRWFYVCVQSLLSIELKPELLQDGQVGRLTSRARHLDGLSDSHSESGSSSSALSSAGESFSSQETSADRSITVADAAPVAMKDPKTKWDDDELQQMIQLKRSGLTHKAIAQRLGRTQSAVENKYGRMMSQRSVASPSLKRRRGQDQDDDEEEDEDEDEDDDEEAQPYIPNKRTRTRV